MASNINANVPAAGSTLASAPIRDNFAAAKSEIESLQLGTFNNLATAGTLTLSGGTANSVLYLNGSKVTTSGASLAFDGTNLGIGLAAPNRKLTVFDATAPYLQLVNTASGSAATDGLLVHLTGSDVTLSNQENGKFTIRTNDTTRIDITAAGVTTVTGSLYENENRVATQADFADVAITGGYASNFTLQMAWSHTHTASGQMVIPADSNAVSLLPISIPTGSSVAVGSNTTWKFLSL